MHSTVRPTLRLCVPFALLLIGLTLPVAVQGQETTTPDAAAAASDVAVPEAGEAGAEGPQEITEEQFKEALQAAEEAMDSEDYEKALQAFSVIGLYGQQKQDGNALVSAVVGQGRAFTGLREFEAAERAYGQILNEARFANFVPALVARGEMFLEMGQPDMALPDFEAAYREARTDPTVNFGLGKSFAQLGQWRSSIKPLTRAIDADPQNAEAYRLRGMAKNGLFKFKESEEDLKQSISLDPEEQEAYFWLAVTYLRLDDYKNATEQFEHAIEHYKPLPDQEDVPYTQAYLTMASAYVELGNQLKDEAGKKAAYTKVLETANRLLDLLDEKNDTHQGVRAQCFYYRGIGERMLENYGQAVQDFSEAIRINPQLGEAYFRRGICYHMLGEDAMAIADFVQTANISYDDPRANLWEGFTYARMGNSLEALRAYSDAIAASDRYAPAYYNRALTYMTTGEYEKALRDFNDAIRFDPKNSEYYLQRGLAQVRLGDHQKASESFTGAVQHNPTSAAAHRHLADALQRLGRTEEASQYRQKANELAPKQ